MGGSDQVGGRVIERGVDGSDEANRGGRIATRRIAQGDVLDEIWA